MTGKYNVEVYDNRIHYQFEIKRNITIIQGESATGKTTLVGMISDYERLGSGAGITLICEKKCVVLSGSNWKAMLDSYKDCIVFVDEYQPYIRSEEFAEAVNSSDNYFVIIYRDSLPQLAYSIEEIYGIREDKKYRGMKQVYNELYKLYNLDNTLSFVPEIVVAEDSNSGFEFCKVFYNDKCVSAEGKSKVCEKCYGLVKNDGKSVLAIVDGAAFGADIKEFLRRHSANKGKCVLYAPESFEYLVLCAGILDVDSDVLEKTYDYADSKEYSSWERFFTYYITEITKNDKVYCYTKKKLAKAYLTEGNLRKIADVMPEICRRLE